MPIGKYAKTPVLKRTSKNSETCLETSRIKYVQFPLEVCLVLNSLLTLKIYYFITEGCFTVYVDVQISSILWVATILFFIYQNVMHSTSSLSLRPASYHE